MATALKGVGVLSILLCLGPPCLSVAIGDLGIGADIERCSIREGGDTIRIPPPDNLAMILLSAAW